MSPSELNEIIIEAGKGILKSTADSVLYHFVSNADPLGISEGLKLMKDVGKVEYSFVHRVKQQRARSTKPIDIYITNDNLQAVNPE